MTPDFISRLVGLIFFAIIGARLGAQTAEFLNLNIESRAFIFGLVGMLFGLVITPWLTVRPIRFLRQIINEMATDRLLMSLIGLSIGLGLGLLAAYPLSLLEAPLGTFGPILFMLLAAYLSTLIFHVRAREIMDTVRLMIGQGANRGNLTPTRKLIVDTSALIDGRIVDVAETNFLGGMLIVPSFVLGELHQVADSSDPLRRERGRRGLDRLNQLKRSEVVQVRMVDDDFEHIAEIDNKLVALAMQMSALLITNDFNLGEVAEAQGILVLNINRLSNAVRAPYIPGDTLAIRIIQEGRDPEQGVGYLDDGTMVIVENGKRYMDRSVEVEVTKFLSRDAGRILFAMPVVDIRRQRSQVDS